MSQPEAHSGHPGGGVARYTGLSGSRLSYALFQLALGSPLPLMGDKELFDSRARLGIARPGAAELSRLVVAIVPDQTQGEELAAALRFFAEQEGKDSPAVLTFFGWEILPFDALSPAESVAGARLAALARLLRGAPGIIVATPDAVMQRVLPVELFRRATLRVAKGEMIDRDRFVALLDARGYVRCSLVEEGGQLSVRGAVIDLFSPNYLHPVRIELFGNRIEALRLFDRGTQRTLRQLESAEIIPSRESLFPWFLEKGDHIVESSELNTALTRLRDRANELELPLRAVEPVEEVLRTGASWPGLEHLQPLFLPAMGSFWDYVPEEALVVVSDTIGVDRGADSFSEVVAERAGTAAAEGVLFPPAGGLFDSVRIFQDRLEEQATHIFDSLPFLSAGSEEALREGAMHQTDPTPAVALNGNGELRQALAAARHSELPFRPLADALQKALVSGVRIAYAVDSPARRRRITEVLAGYDIHTSTVHRSFSEWRADPDRPRMPALLEGYCPDGFLSPSEGIWLIADAEIFPEGAVRKRTVSSRTTRRFVGSLNQITENDYIVHMDHGVGIYRGLKQISVAGRVGDFLTLEYADGAKLFLPVENIGKIEKYLGGEGVKPELSKLGGKAWAKTKQKVKDRVAELAGHLITLYAEREVAERPAYNEVDADDLRFAGEFPFQETADQEKAIEAVLADMTRESPMDRLVCGDVGYGKTEVALRAVFKAVNAGKQVAFLVPTTILADQHFATVKDRFKEFPFSVACISRFFSPQENKDTLAKVASGKLDIVVGTHRLLQKDVLFQNLGLIVIDEEHKFGVKDKERLKNLRKNVDVLTLTATPIPRTLHMSLLDIRDLSIIETPPVDRQVIRTYVAPYQDGVVREAIMREIGRGGQVFFIHNRVASIGLITQQLSELVPEAKINFAHGQMKEHELEDIMHRFISGEIQVLVSTTIVESGLDIPNANTIIIREADKLGLAELYQLRGRVGRSSRRAYAYLLVASPQTLGEDAKKRLQVLQSLDDLGQGFRLALQDMEIRGAGNLLGKDQSGHIELVGFDLYSRILKEAVRELRRKERAQQEPEAGQLDVDPEVSVGFPAHIPEFYIPDIEERLLLYQRLSELRNPAEITELHEEFEDRFGHLPPEVVSLLELTGFRAVLRRYGVVNASLRGEQLSLSFHPQAPLDPVSAARTVASGRSIYRITPSGNFVVRVEPDEVTSPQVLTDLAERVLPGLFALRE